MLSRMVRMNASHSLHDCGNLVPAVPIDTSGETSPACRVMSKGPYLKGFVGELMLNPSLPIAH
jgi:hypothetical protein